MKRKIVSILLAGLLVTGIFGCGESASTEDSVQTTDESSQTSDDNTESADASEQLSQEYIYAYITALEGNEVTYVEVEESVIEAMQEEKEEMEKEDEKGTGEEAEKEEGTEIVEKEAGERPEMGEAPEGEERPEMGEAPEGEERPEMGETPEGEDRPEMAEVPNDAEKTEMSGETVTTYIPVGTIVHTADGAETTFSRLAAGDIVKILVETDDSGEAVIVEIWMVEQ